MLVVMKPQATAEEIQAVCEQIQMLGFRAHPMPGRSAPPLESPAIVALSIRATSKNSPASRK